MSKATNRTMAVIVTPHDLGSPDDGRFACCDLKLIPGAGIFVRPELGNILVTKALEEVVAHVGRRRILVLSHDSLALGLNRWLRLAGAVEIQSDHVEFLDAWADECGVDMGEAFPFQNGDDVAYLRDHPQFLLGRFFTVMGHVLAEDRRCRGEYSRSDLLFMKDEALEKAEEERRELEHRVIEQRKRNSDEDADITVILRETAPAPIGRVRTEAEKRRILSLEKEIKAHVFGQDHAVDAVCEQLILARAGLQRANRPIGGFLFAGPTGVGKTELARQLALSLGVPMLRLDMSEYYDRHAISGLIGATSGYKDSQRGGVLTNAVVKDPNTIILFDEVEKGHPNVVQLLLQILDAGRLTDGRGEVVDFRATTILMTTNLGARGMAKKRSIGFTEQDTPDAEGDEILESVKASLLPELRNRLDRILVFSRLDPSRMPLFVGKAMGALKAQLLMTGTTLKLAAEAEEWLGRHGYDADCGARPLDRLIDVEIRRPAARQMLVANALGGTIAVDCGPKGLCVTATPPVPQILDKRQHSALTKAYLKERADEKDADVFSRMATPLSVAEITKKALSEPERVIVITPPDVVSLTRDEYGMVHPPEKALYACMRIRFEENECFAERPSEGTVLVTDDLEAVRAYVDESAYMVFDEWNLQLINVDGAVLDPARAEFLAHRAKMVGEAPGADIYYLGYQGGSGLNLPETPVQITPYYTALWFLEILNFVMGIEEQKRLFEL